ncbi:MAG: NAD-dependent epimerase/dehydratase family protein [Algoriphagus sp.]|uniref:NAD-dependent epimerase/dehydratase family protein n=1 Tax=Algoriphagus sp. TaxID=1872435 RepID=UPI002637414E|nr:NAD-dependent epimerase/dehydratase family protein [Algoriphagus sp.]MDG1276684.1 NAD-dependent epimerase/dehydratase family protein [Algoriphagus sp.]
MATYTILGANGNIAQEVSKALAQPKNQIRQFSRNPKKVNDSDELFPGNLLNAAEVSKAVKGSDVVFLLAGIQYNKKIWRRDWPIIMRNALDACISHGAKLVFFDNMYAFDPNEVGHLTEDSTMAPQSEKGKVRKEILDMLWKDVKVGKLTALVARAADFYGPGASNSFLNELVIDKMKAGKSPQWLYAGDKKHSFTYIPDAGKATAFLAQQEDSWNQSWHLPTDPAYPSGQEITTILNKKLGKNLKLKVLPAFAVSLLGLFIAPLREVKELRYQTDSDYCFDSSKIKKVYGLKPTPIEVGLYSCL